MEIKTFFFKKVVISFFVTVTCIVLAMALVGLIFDPDVRFGYEAFFSPLIFGLITSLPLFIKYSKHELSIGQSLLRDGIYLLLIELLILSVLYFNQILTSLSMALSLAFSIFIINVTVKIVLWINDKKTADEFNKALKVYQK
jgi:hypothetical protein